MSEFKKAMEKYAKYVVQQARSNLSKGKNNASKQLYNSLNYDVKQNRTSGGQFATGYNAEFFMEDYGIYQDLGVRGKTSYYADKGTASSPFQYKNKMPPPKSLQSWIKRDKIKGRDKKTGRFISYESLSYIIAKSIQHKGIRATLFFTKPFEAGINKYGDEIAGGFGDDILKQL